MAYSIGGATIKRMDITKSWGLTPGSASIQAVGVLDYFQPGYEVTLNVGSQTFHGIIDDNVLTEADGRTLSIRAKDNRIKLMWDTVFCYFNGVEIIEDDPSTPGIDRKKRYWHIYPEDWDALTKTYTEDPLSAEDILDELISADTVGQTWTIGSHSRLALPVYGIDAQNGKKLGTVIQEVLEKLSLLMTLDGANTLMFAVKGDGVAPTPSILNSDNRSEGAALGADTRVRIVGDRNIYQDLPINLEPDWNSSYEQFWYKPAWVEEVKAVFSLTDQSEIDAFAREVTLREYCEVKGAGFDDFGFWGEVSRMEIPVWIYIDDIVYKSYRVPRDFTINNIPLESLQMREGLLCAVGWTSGGALSYDTSDLYPESKAFCLVRGQPLSLYDPKTQAAITPEQLAAWSTQWQPVNRFNLDPKNKAVIFEEPLFISGSGANALFIKPNAAATVDGGAEGDAIKNIVVPNANATITAAEVRASLTFEAEQYGKYYGSGDRNAVAYVPGLNYHARLEDGSWVSEILYDGGKSADDMAEEAAEAALSGLPTILSGGYDRYGTAGMALNGVIDRVTASVSFESGSEGEGIKERIDYTKERAVRVFDSERELDRRLAARETPQEIRRLLEEATKIRNQGKLSKTAKRQSERGYESLDDTGLKVVGNKESGAKYVKCDSAFSYPVGMPCFVGDEEINGVSQQVLSATSARFAGVIIQANLPPVQHSDIAVATQGVVPCRVQGPVRIGDVVGCDSGENYAKKSGKKVIGTCQQNYSGSSTVLLNVKLGISNAETNHPFYVLTQPKPGDPETLQAGVVYNSSLYKSLRPNDKLAISGLLTSPNPAPDDAGWFDLLSADAIWLGIVWTGGVPAASIDSWGQDDAFDITAEAWTYGPSYVDDDGEDPPVFQSARKLIAYSVAGDEGEPVLTQVMKTDQLLRNVNIDGVAAIYPFSHEGGYPF